MAEYGGGRSTSSRDARSLLLLCDLSTTISLCSMNHIYIGHEKTAMTSETSENPIFVRFYLTLCYLMLTNRKSQNKYYRGEIMKSIVSRAARRKSLKQLVDEVFK